MSRFSLIAQLGQSDDDTKTKLPAGIKYQQYEITVEGQDRIINIPLRETDNFEQAINELKDPLTNRILKKMLREFRGIRG